MKGGEVEERGGESEINKRRDARGGKMNGGAESEERIEGSERGEEREGRE